MSDGPIGTRSWRVTRAIHLHYSKGWTQDEIADELGVSQPRISEYIHEEPGEETREQLAIQQAKTRQLAWEDLTTQLHEAGARTDSPQKPVEVWTDENDDIEVADIHDANGQVIDRNPIPQSFEMGQDAQEEFYGRSEKRDILDRMAEITGVYEDNKDSAAEAVESLAQALSGDTDNE